MANYYYLSPERIPIGPVALEGLRDLGHRGIVRSETMVAREGDPHWVPYSELVVVEAPPPLAAPLTVDAFAPQPVTPRVLLPGQAVQTPMVPERRVWLLLPLGCLAVIALPLLVILGFRLATVFAHSTEPYRTAVVRVKGNEVAADLLGRPIRIGSSSLSVAYGSEDRPTGLSLSVSGGKRSGRVEVRAEKHDGRWTYSQLDLIIDDSGETVDLRKTARHAVREGSAHVSGSGRSLPR